MDMWMDGWIDEGMWLDKWMDLCICAFMDKWEDKGIDGQVKGESIGGWIDEHVGGQMNR